MVTNGMNSRPFIETLGSSDEYINVPIQGKLREDVNLVDVLRSFDNGKTETHYPNCWQSHPVCAGYVAANEIELLQENAEYLHSVITMLRGEVSRLGSFLHPVGMVINTEHGTAIPKAGIEGVTDEEVNEYLKEVRGE